MEYTQIWLNRDDEGGTTTLYGRYYSDQKVLQPLLGIVLTTGI
jgi:hypothetical protein